MMVPKMLAGRISPPVTKPARVRLISNWRVRYVGSQETKPVEAKTPNEPPKNIKGIGPEKNIESNPGYLNSEEGFSGEP